jgi:hypothetical protein
MFTFLRRAATQIIEGSIDGEYDSYDGLLNDMQMQTFK